jgi:hypothetical protein
LAFGDSVSAGYGLGPAEGHGDNPSAYPAVLGQLLGNVPVLNESVDGVCASSTEPECTSQPHSVDWQIRQVPGYFKPSVITMTVGADDIDFKDCLLSIFGPPFDFKLQSTADPCSPNGLPYSLGTNLSEFQQSLTTDLQTLSSNYPGVSIYVMDYYNPFPPPPSATASPCVLGKVYGVPYEKYDLGESWYTIGKNFVLHHAKFVNDARAAQAQLYNDAQSILGQLNATINAAAAGIANVVNTNDFTGHSICGPGAQWVFYPTAAAKFSVTIPIANKTFKFAFGGEICPDPVPANEWNAHQTVNTKYLQGTLAVGENCVPHPTTVGQQSIANDFLQQGA